MPFPTTSHPFASHGPPARPSSTGHHLAGQRSSSKLIHASKIALNMMHI